MALPRAGGASLALLALIAAGTTGCAAAGLAGGPLVSAVQAIGDRAVERTVAADLRTATAALEAVLLRSAVRVEERKSEGDTVRLRAAGAKVTAEARLERVTSSMTKVSLRVETGGLLADRQTSEHLQAQLALALSPPTAPVKAIEHPASREGLAALEGEVRELRAAIDARGSMSPSLAGRPTEDAPATAPAFTVNRRGVVTIPESYGLPTVVSAPAAAPTTSIRTPAAGEQPTTSVQAEADSPATPLARPLTPVMRLTPADSVSSAARTD